MFDLPGTDRTTSLLLFYLDTQSRRAQVVASNVANADTPGYLSKELDFGEALRQAAYGSAAPDSALRGPDGGALLTTNSLDGISRPSADRLDVVDQKGKSMGVDG